MNKFFRSTHYIINLNNSLRSMLNATKRNNLKIIVPFHRTRNSENKNMIIKRVVWRMQWLQDFEKRILES